MCKKKKSIKELRQSIADKFLSLTDSYTIEEIIQIIYRECDICEEQKKYALDILDDLFDRYAESIPCSDKYHIRQW